jgi:hypothetical protein
MMKIILIQSNFVFISLFARITKEDGNCKNSQDRSFMACYILSKIIKLVINSL